jgi:hypothetical protein
MTVLNMLTPMLLKRLIFINVPFLTIPQNIFQQTCKVSETLQVFNC